MANRPLKQLVILDLPAARMFEAPEYTPDPKYTSQRNYHKAHRGEITGYHNAYTKEHRKEVTAYRKNRYLKAKAIAKPHIDKLTTLINTLREKLKIDKDSPLRHEWKGYLDAYKEARSAIRTKVGNCY
jgi:hypothetical protein